jgi:hypothetical protein
MMAQMSTIPQIAAMRTRGENTEASCSSSGRCAPSVIATEMDPCCLFLAVDATAVSDTDIRNMAKGLLQHGIAYLCVWGPDCERVHDQFDLERMPDEPKGPPVREATIRTCASEWLPVKLPKTRLFRRLSEKPVYRPHKWEAWKSTPHSRMLSHSDFSQHRRARLSAFR